MFQITSFRTKTSEVKFDDKSWEGILVVSEVWDIQNQKYVGVREVIVDRTNVLVLMLKDKTEGINSVSSSKTEALGMSK